MDYKNEYYSLFNSVSDAIKLLEHQNYGLGIHLLKHAQQKCEEIYMQSPKKD